MLDLVTAASFINFGALVAFTFVNLSVVAYYVKNRNKTMKKNFATYVVLPLIGASVMIWLWASLDKHALWLGSIWTLTGVVYMAVQTKLFRERPPEFDFFSNAD